MALMPSAWAGPQYQPTRHELESVMADLIAWLPGAWDSYPQVHYQRRYVTPVEGEHPHWHHVFERIDAPQIGEVVFYGQINPGGRDKPLMHRSQILYKVWIDEARGAVVVNGQGPENPDRFVNLHERPELWGEVKMRDEKSLQCDFLWRRDGEQIVGLLEGKTPERRKNGLGTCTYTVKGTDVEFFADAEWVLGPDIFWDYDINTMSGHQFVGRKDRTHIKQYRARGYQCRVEDSDGVRDWHAHDRGANIAVMSTDKKSYRLMLLRAPLPDAAGAGMHDQLRLALLPLDSEQPIVEVSAAPLAAYTQMNHAGVKVRCDLAKGLPPMHSN
ncbi:MAG: hypothetical protein RLY56_1905 [Pseudomonadota bacterium]